jgi:hypothetical protein
MSNSTRSLVRLIERLEEFLDEYKTDLEADEAALIDETISVIDRVKNELESADEDEDD